ncbi:hypothetical protein MRX96_051602 [Rhipicephalus microplus]
MTPLLLYSALAKGLAHLRLARRCCDLRPSKIGLAARSKDTGGELGRFALGGGREAKNKSGTQAGPRSFIMVVCACVRQRRAALGPHTNALRLRDKARPRRGSLDCNTPAVRNSGSALRRRRR